MTLSMVGLCHGRRRAGLRWGIWMKRLSKSTLVVSILLLLLTQLLVVYCILCLDERIERIEHKPWDKPGIGEAWIGYGKMPWITTAPGSSVEPAVPR